MEKTRIRESTVVFILAVAAILWIPSQRAIDDSAPGAPARLAKRGIERMLPMATAFAGAETLENVITGRAIVDGAPWAEGDWNGDTFDILSFRHGLARSTDGGGPVFGDLAFAKRVNRSSPKLAEAVARGRVFPKVEIELTATYGGAGLLPYLRYELSNVRVTSHQIMGGYGEDAIQSGFWGSETVNELAELVRINFEEIKVTYTEYDEVGSPKSDIEFGWKIKEGEP